MHPALRAYVVAVTAYDVDLGTPGVHRGLPSTALTFVLPQGVPLDIGWADDPDSRRPRWSTVSGLHDRPAAIFHDGTQRGVQVDLTVTGARALFGVPAADLAGEILELDEACPELRHLPEQLAESGPARTPWWSSVRWPPPSRAVGHHSRARRSATPSGA